jgi:hypothetical protein
MKLPTLLLFAILTPTARATERWGVFELSFTGPATGHPYLDVQWAGTFRQGDRVITVPGFWDGGGNRLVHFLSRDHSGVDLVCHTDGRLCLVVNQWPDSVRNDSPPGKLQVANGLPSRSPIRQPQRTTT